MDKGLHIYFEGRVQGVGFRFTALHLANRYGIKGWVMNLSDGRVELVAEGERQALDDFLNSLRSELKPYITNVRIKEIPVSGDYKDFQIRFS